MKTVSRPRLLHLAAYQQANWQAQKKGRFRKCAGVVEYRVLECVSLENITACFKATTRLTLPYVSSASSMGIVLSASLHFVGLMSLLDRAIDNLLRRMCSSVTCDVCASCSCGVLGLFHCAWCLFVSHDRHR